MQSLNDHSVNFIEERDDEDVDANPPNNRSQVFQKVNVEEADEEEPDDIDILDGYLTYDMSEFHGMLGENIDFDLEDSDSDSDQASPNMQTQSQRNSTQVNHSHLPPSVYNIQGVTENSTQDIRMPGRSGSDHRAPILEGEEMDPDIDLDMEEQESARASEDDDDDDLNLFDSIDEELDENNDPYRIMIRYPNEEYKVSIFCPRMSEYDIDRKGQQIVLRNSEILSDHVQMDDFYHYLRKLGIQRELRILTFEDLLKHDLLATIQGIIRAFENFRDFQQKWLEVSPTYTLSNKLQTYSLQLERFTEMAKYIMAHNSRNPNGRRMTQNRTQFYHTEPTRSKREVRSQRNTFSQQRDQDIAQKSNQSPFLEQQVESTQMSVVLFKAQELHNQYLQFLHVRQTSEQYKKIMDSVKRAKSRYKVSHLVQKEGLFISQRIKKSMHFQPNFSEGGSPEIRVKKINVYQECFNQNFNQKKIQGLNTYFTNLIEKYRNFQGPSQQEKQSIDTIQKQLYNIKNSSRHQRFQTNSYLVFNFDEED